MQEQADKIDIIVECEQYKSIFSETGGYAAEYMEKMSKNGEWGDGLILANAAELYGRKILVHSETETPIMFSSTATSASTADHPIHLGYVGSRSNRNHYVSLKCTRSSPSGDQP